MSYKLSTRLGDTHKLVICFLYSFWDLGKHFHSSGYNYNSSIRIYGNLNTDVVDNTVFSNYSATKK